MKVAYRLATLCAVLLSLSACGSFREEPSPSTPDPTPTAIPATPTLTPSTPTPEPTPVPEEPTPTPTEEPFGYNAMDCTVTSQAAIPVCQAALLACMSFYPVDVASPAIEAAAAATECQLKRASECPDAVHLLNDNSWLAGLACIYCPYYCACEESEDGALYECGGESTVPTEPYPFRTSSPRTDYPWQFGKALLGGAPQRP